MKYLIILVRIFFTFSLIGGSWIFEPLLLPCCIIINSSLPISFKKSSPVMVLAVSRPNRSLKVFMILLILDAFTHVKIWRPLQCAFWETRKLKRKINSFGRSLLDELPNNAYYLLTLSLENISNQMIIIDVD